MPAAGGTQMRQGVAQHVERREDVDVEVAPQFHVRQRLDRALLAVTRIVHHPIDAAEMGDGPLDGGFGAGLIGQIERQRQKLRAVFAERAAQARKIPRGGGNSIALGQNLTGQRQANAARGSGDEPDVFERGVLHEKGSIRSRRHARMEAVSRWLEPKRQWEAALGRGLWHDCLILFISRNIMA